MIQQPAMSEPKARVWKKIVCFYALTMLFSSVCGAFVLHAGKMDAGNLLYVTGAMWSPGLAAFATKKLFKESSRDLQWRWGNFANYNLGAPAWYSATCFTISVVSDSFIMAWLTLRARSL